MPTFTGVAVPLAVTFAIAAQSLTYIAASINGTCHPLNITYAAAHKAPSTVPELSRTGGQQGKGRPNLAGGGMSAV